MTQPHESREVYEQRRMDVADYILERPEEFDMAGWGWRGPQCGTVACLAGTAVLQAERQGLCRAVWNGPTEITGTLSMVYLGLGPHGYSTIDSFAEAYLGMTGTTLFYEFNMNAEEAAKALLDAPYVDERA